jgi:carboxypeptidase PM20D1
LRGFIAGTRKAVISTVAMVLLLLVAVVLIRTASFRAVEPVVEAPPAVTAPAGSDERLAGAVRIPTISYEDPDRFDGDAFIALHRHLEVSFPGVHSTLTREVVGNYSLLYTWPGTDPSLEPVLLMGHLDVVPVEPGTEQLWTHPPFAGVIADGYVWGRGAIDDKASVLGTLEAVEALIATGFRPARTLYLSYGHDEEVGGRAGAAAIAALLQSRGVRLAMVLDEGGVIGDGLLPGLTRPTALIGVAEKGYVSVELSARSAGGHSSMPPGSTAVGRVSAAVARLESGQMPVRLDGAALQMFRNIGPGLPLVQRAVFANLWLTRPLVVRQLQGTPSSNAMVRTTTAATIFEGGSRANVLPAHARAVLNFRILPGDSVAGVLAHVRRIVDDGSIDIRLAEEAWEPSGISPTDAAGFRLIERTIHQLIPEAIVSPYLVLGATDARHFSGLSDNVYRFLPIRMEPADLERMHGTNERVGVRDYERAILFYILLVRALLI